MKHLYIFFFITPFLSFAGANQESTLIEALNLDLAVSVSDNKTINEISSSIVKSEAWLKTHVLSLYPSTKITTLVIVFPDSPSQTTDLDLVLSSLKNLHHSLTRWGLEKEIKVSLGLNYPKNLEMFKPVFLFLKSINSTFTITNPPLNHFGLLQSVEKFGSLRFNKVNFLNPKPELEQEASTTKKRMTRRSLINISSKITIHFPTLPTPSPIHSSIGSPTNPNSPISSPIGFSDPNTNPNSPIALPRNPIPPISQPTNPIPPIAQPTNPNSPISQPTNPNSPIAQPTNPNPPISQPRNQNPPIPQPPISTPELYLPPPCLPSPPAPSPATKKKKDVEGLWCVAKPTVAAETLQQALDFACGEGGADCDEIRYPHGICFYPDTVMAHASYALNSYWQKTKRNGGTCSFGGTAMLITTDPSYQHCRFILS